VLRSLAFDIYRFRFCKSNVISLQLGILLNIFLSTESFPDKLKGCAMSAVNICMYFFAYTLVYIMYLSLWRNLYLFLIVSYLC